MGAQALKEADSALAPNLWNPISFSMYLLTSHPLLDGAPGQGLHGSCSLLSSQVWVPPRSTKPVLGP